VPVRPTITGELRAVRPPSGACKSGNTNPAARKRAGAAARPRTRALCFLVWSSEASSGGGAKCAPFRRAPRRRRRLGRTARRDAIVTIITHRVVGRAARGGRRRWFGSATRRAAIPKPSHVSARLRDAHFRNAAPRS